MGYHQPMFGSPSFLTLIVFPHRGTISPYNLGNGTVLVALLLLSDEPSVLGKPAGIEQEPHPVAVAEGPRLPLVGATREIARAIGGLGFNVTPPS